MDFIQNQSWSELNVIVVSTDSKPIIREERKSI